MRGGADGAAFAVNDSERRALATLRAPPWPPAWRDAAELESLADASVARLRAMREEQATSWAERLSVHVDRLILTDATELLDSPTYPEHRKLRQVHLLHLQNVVIGAYRRYLAELEPSIAASARRRQGGKARVLELASGYGELALNLARLATKAGLAAEVTGSDVVPAYVEHAARRAAERGIDARFRLLDAFELPDLRPGDVDVALIAQSMHHFTPGQLARMIARVGEIGASHFVGIDGRRSLALLAALPVLAAVTFDGGHLHDAWVSARRMFSPGELAAIAEIAAPGARVEVRARFEGIVVVQVDYPPRPT